MEDSTIEMIKTIAVLLAVISVTQSVYGLMNNLFHSHARRIHTLAMNKLNIIEGKTKSKQIKDGFEISLHSETIDFNSEINCELAHIQTLINNVRIYCDEAGL